MTTYRYLVACAICSACAPSIQSFSVSPQVVCGQEPVWAHWRARGAAALRTFDAAPAGPDAATIETYSLVVIRGDQTPTEADYACDLSALALGESAPCGRSVVQIRQVQRYRDSASVPIAALARLQGDSLVVDVTLAGAFVADSFRIVGVATTLQRRLELRHAERVGQLSGSGMVTHAMDGTAASGPWHIATALTAAEQADPSKRPRDLSVIYSAVCGKGGK